MMLAKVIIQVRILPSELQRCLLVDHTAIIELRKDKGMENVIK